ncbi:5-histidylcysteine sulfoxide synthase [Flavobacteriales bacterium]|nr:5-histidylcysteine sulfoxide synthase [Flavobacteriales bacterium]
MESLVEEKLSSLSAPSLIEINKSELKSYFENAWKINEVLFSGINTETAFYKSPDPLRNPLIFYWGHTAVFYINKFILAGVITDRINPHFENIFARGVDPDLPENLDILDVWPKVSEVNEYRETAYRLISDIIDNLDDSDTINENHPMWSLMMSIEHDRIHFETSSVLMRQLDTEFLTIPNEWSLAPSNGTSPSNELIQIQGGKLSYGKDQNDGVFGWDNEYGKKSTNVEPFQVCKNMISNEDYLSFVESGEYNNQKHWSEEGWEWKTRVFALSPRFWVENEGGFLYRSQFENISMPLSWPAEVNAHEALAYCSWLNDGSRLLTEDEYQFLLLTEADKDHYPNINHDKSNVNLKFNSPTPVDYFQDLSNSPINDLQGNVWEWLSSEFKPLEGFSTHRLYEDFSNPYFDNEHNMMLGGSWATTGYAANFFYRLWFRRHFYQHAGFRIAKSA